MKINRHGRPLIAKLVKLAAIALMATVGWSVAYPTLSRADHRRTDQSDRSTKAPNQSSPRNQSDPEAVRFLRQMLDFIGNGPAFDALVRETVWTSGRAVVGVGSYEQAGGGSGQYNLQLTMHDGDGKHRLQQISDGKLAWTRTEISGEISLRRVDVGRLEDWVRGTTDQSDLSPKLKVGAWGEMLDTFQRDYALRMDTAILRKEAPRGSTPAQAAPESKRVPMRVLIGDLKPERRSEVLRDAKRTDWPYLYPTRVHVVVKANRDTETGLGQWVPSRIEFWSDPIATVDSDGSPKSRRRMITLIELYSLRQISPPPPERFRFDNQDAEINFVNETDRYVESYGVNLTQGQRRQLYR